MKVGVVELFTRVIWFAVNLLWVLVSNSGYPKAFCTFIRLYYIYKFIGLLGLSFEQLVRFGVSVEIIKSNKVYRL